MKKKLAEEQQKIKEMLALILPIYYKDPLLEVENTAEFFKDLLKSFENSDKGETNWDEEESR